MKNKLKSPSYPNKIYLPIKKRIIGEGITFSYTGLIRSIKEVAKTLYIREETI